MFHQRLFSMVLQSMPRVDARILPRSLSKEHAFEEAREATRQMHFSKHPIGPLVLGHSSRHARRRHQKLDTSWCLMTTKRKPRPTPPARPARHRHPDRMPPAAATSCDETAHAVPHMIVVIATIVAIELGAPVLAGFFIWGLSRLKLHDSDTATSPNQDPTPSEDLAEEVSNVVRIYLLAAVLRLVLLGTAFWAFQAKSTLLASLVLGTSIYLDFTGSSRFPAPWPTTDDLATWTRVTLLTSAFWAFQSGSLLLASMVLKTSIYLDFTASSRHPTPLPSTEEPTYVQLSSPSDVEQPCLSRSLFMALAVLATGQHWPCVALLLFVAALQPPDSKDHDTREVLPDVTLARHEADTTRPSPDKDTRKRPWKRRAWVRTVHALCGSLPPVSSS